MASRQLPFTSESGSGAGNSPAQAEEPSALRIVLIDADEFLRTTVAELLRREEGPYEIVGEFSSAAEGITGCERLAPDIAVVDVDLPDGSGLSIVSSIRQVSPATRIMLYSAAASDNLLIAAIDVGAHGFFARANSWSTFIEALPRVARGERYFSTRQTSNQAGAARPQPPESSTSRIPLTPRELEVLTEIAAGLTSKEIAAKLGISVGTAETHRANLMSKLRLKNAAEVVVYAFRTGLLKL